MSAQYDNTNTVAIFGPKPMEMVGSGRINVSGTDTNALLMRVKTTNGKVVDELYVKVGAVFPNTRNTSEKAPQFFGSIDLPEGELNQISLWERQDRNGNAYLQGKLSYYEKQQNGGGSSFGRGVPSRNHDLDDDIPF